MGVLGEKWAKLIAHNVAMVTSMLINNVPSCVLSTHLKYYYSSILVKMHEARKRGAAAPLPTPGIHHKIRNTK